MIAQERVALVDALERLIRITEDTQDTAVIEQIVAYEEALAAAA